MVPDDTLDHDAETGFLDVAANALALMIFATMMVLIVAAPPLIRGMLPQMPRFSPVMPTPFDMANLPFSAYYFVTRAGVTPIDLRVFIDIQRDNPATRASLGTSTFRVERSRYRDLDDYSFTLTPDLDAVHAAATPLEDAELRAGLIAALRDGMEGRNEVPTFLVIDGGYEGFAPFYEELRAEGLALRWFFVPNARMLELRRSFLDFETEARQFQ